MNWTMKTVLAKAVENVEKIYRKTCENFRTNSGQRTQTVVKLNYYDLNIKRSDWYFLNEKP